MLTTKQQNKNIKINEEHKFIFVLEFMSLICKIMEQCRLFPEKLWSNAKFAPQNQGTFVRCPAKLPSLFSFPSKLCSNADFALQNSGDINLGAKVKTEIFLNPSFFKLFCKSLNITKDCLRSLKITKDY